MLIIATHSAELAHHNHAIARLLICVNKIKITDGKDYERLHSIHWDYRASVRDYSYVRCGPLVTLHGPRLIIGTSGHVTGHRSRIDPCGTAIYSYS